MRAYEDLVAEAEAADVSGWGFDWLDGRAQRHGHRGATCACWPSVSARFSPLWTLTLAVAKSSLRRRCFLAGWLSPRAGHPMPSGLACSWGRAAWRWSRSRPAIGCCPFLTSRSSWSPRATRCGRTGTRSAGS